MRKELPQEGICVGTQRDGEDEGEDRILEVLDMLGRIEMNKSFLSLCKNMRRSALLQDRDNTDLHGVSEREGMGRHLRWVCDE